MSEEEPRPKIIAIDFDGVIHDFKLDTELNDLNVPFPGTKQAIDFLKQQLDYVIIIYTCRSDLVPVKQWLKYYEIYYDFINENPYQPEDNSPSKLMADIYLDDRGIRFENWESALQIITNLEGK